MSLLIALIGLLPAGPSGELAFVSGTEQEDLCVFVMDLSTGATHRVGHGARDGAPQWSPDGRSLAFESVQPGGIGIRIVQADGSQARALRHHYAWNHDPRWSPDGRLLAYTADRDMGMEQTLLVYDLETDQEESWGGDPATPPAWTGAFRPVWLPTTDLMTYLAPGQDFSENAFDPSVLKAEAEDSGVIVFIALVGQPGSYSTEIFLATRTQAVPLLPILVKDSPRFTEWAIEPNAQGRRLAFESNDGGDREIFAIGTRGMTDVSNHRAADWNPVWAPGGKWLAFESFRDGRRGVYRCFPDTARVFPVATSPNYDSWSPAWSPDDQWLAFVSNRTGNPEIFVSDPTGDHLQQVTQNPGLDYAPAWRPRGK